MKPPGDVISDVWNDVVARKHGEEAQPDRARDVPKQELIEGLQALQMAGVEDLVAKLESHEPAQLEDYHEWYEHAYL